MHSNIKYLLFVLCLMYSFPAKSDAGLLQGLYFCSFEVDKDKRTSLNLTPNKPMVFKNGFSMEFDIKLRREKEPFGYVFRIICNDTLNMDFLVHEGPVPSNFTLVVKNQTLLQFNNSELGSTIENSWINVCFAFDPNNNNISLSINGVKKEAALLLKGLKHFSVYFGGNAHRFFSTTDIISMTVKDIRFFDQNKKLIRHWELSKHSSDDVYDECISDRAVTQNPAWEIDRHTKWTKRGYLTIESKIPQITFNRSEDRIYVANDIVVLTYDINRQKVDTFDVFSGNPFSFTRSNQIVYGSNRHHLISYEHENKRVATFDFLTCRWNNRDTSAIIIRFSHHNRLFVTEDDMLITFGGYGHHRYNSLFYKCQVAKNIWKVDDLSLMIAPRYLGSMGHMEDNNLLLFGGFGNKSGLQEEFPNNYYDLYTIDIDKATVKKIWELPQQEEDFTNSNSLVIDRSNGKFYALAYPNRRYSSVITLHEYYLDKPEFRMLGNSIPYFFNDIESYCDLFQSSDSSILYAFTSYASENGSDINIYSIAFPPLSYEETIQYPSTQTKVWVWFLPIILSFGLVAVFIVYGKRKTAGAVSKENEQIYDNEEEAIVYHNLFTEKKSSSINLLGNFQIVDSAGNKITKNFTPTTTQLFLLLLMSNIRNGQGVTSQELQKIIWFDNEDESARNNRNVYTSRLRSVLKSFEDISVINRDGYWSVQSEKTVFCDYEKALMLMKILQTNDHFNKKLLNELVDIALRGTLLPYLQQTEWLDPFQTDYANQVITCLKRYSRYNDVKTDLMLLLKIADVILLHDNIDEDAIRLKCFALFRLGRRNQALQVFNKFSSDYENLLATKHKLIFAELVKSI